MANNIVNIPSYPELVTMARETVILRLGIADMRHRPPTIATVEAIDELEEKEFYISQAGFTVPVQEFTQLYPIQNHILS